MQDKFYLTAQFQYDLTEILSNLLKPSAFCDILYNTKRRERCAVSDKERVIKLLEDVPAYKLGFLIAYMQGLIAAEEPNETTYAAMESAQNGDDLYGPYDSVSELMENIEADQNRHPQ